MEFSSKNNATYRAIHGSLHAEIIIKLTKLCTSKEHNIWHGEEGSAGWKVTAETATRTKPTVTIPVNYEVI